MSNQTMNVTNSIQSVSQLIERLSTFSPLTAIGTKNFERVVQAVVTGENVVEVIENPVELAGVAKQQAHVFAKFLEANPLPKKLRRIKNIRVIVAQADLKTISDDELVSQRDYSDFGLVGEDHKSGYKEVSGSYAFEMLAPYHNATPQMITTKKMINGELMTREVMAYVLPHVFFIDLNGNEEGDLPKKQAIVLNGLNYIDHEGEMRKALYLFRSPSQERVVQIVSIAEHIVHPVDALKAVGNDPLAFAKYVKDSEGNIMIDGEGNYIYKLDIIKAMKRFGLTLSNSVKSNFIRFGKDVSIDPATGDIIISGGNIVARIVEDVYSEVNEGQYKAFDKINKKGRIFNASEYSVKQIAGDGQMYINEKIKTLGEQEFGRDFQNGVARLFSGFVKGNVVYTPGLDDYFEEDIIIPMSSFKASTDTLEDVIEDLELQFRVALFGSPMKKKKMFVGLPYQFTHGMKLSAQTMFKLVQPHLDRVKTMINDPKAMEEYLGLDKLDNMDDLTLLEQEDAVMTSLVSTLTTFMYYSPESYNDVYLKEKALYMLQELVKEWKAGSIPVEANYRFLVMDPYAILDTYKSRGTNKEIRKNGELYVDPKAGVRAGSVFMKAKDGKNIHEGKIAMARNPQMTKGQSRIVYGVKYSRYMKAKDAFDGLIVMSCHDFNAIAQGGADFDGDTSLCMTQPELIQAVESACKTAPAFLDIHFVQNQDGTFSFADGCPFLGDEELVKANKDKYTFTFTKEQYTRDFQMEMYKTSLDYVAETLKPNRIGELTNFATKLADAVRALGYKAVSYATSGDHKQYEQTIERIKELEEKIDLLAWVQSWEIDRAKHGGAYEEALKEELDFLENPPVEVSYYDMKAGKMKWFTPDWMAARSEKEVDGQAVQRTNSVLSLVNQYINKWEETELVSVVKEMRADYHNHNILSFIASAVQLPQNPAAHYALVSSVRNVKTEYNVMMSNAHTQNRLALDEMKFMTFGDEHAEEMKLNEIKRQLNDAQTFAVEKAQAELIALSSTYSLEQIGLVAYKETYGVSSSNRNATQDQPARGLSFPWITMYPLLAAVRLASNKEDTIVLEPQVRHFDSLDVNKVNIGNFAPGFDGQAVFNMISNWSNHVAIKVEADQFGNMTHSVFVKKQRVASIFPEYITHFTGGTKFLAQGSDFKVNAKSLSFNLVQVKSL